MNTVMLDLRWSRPMILKALDILLLLWVVLKIPENIMNEIRSIQTVVSTVQFGQFVNKMRDEMDNDCKVELNKLIYKIVELEKREVLPIILGLHGSVNVAVPSINRPGGPLVKSTRGVLMDITINMIHTYLGTECTMKRCSRYVAFFEADKVAGNLETSFFHPLNDEQLKRLINDIGQEFEILMAHDEPYPKCQSGDLESVEKFLFDDTDYWLIPTFRSDAAIELRGHTRFSLGQLDELGLCKKVFKSMFGILVDKIKDKNYEKAFKTRLVYYESAQKTIFKKHVLEYIRGVCEDDSKVLKYVNNEMIATPPAMMMTEVEANDLMGRLLKKRKREEPLVIKQDDVSKYFPIISPENQLCVTLHQAHEIWSSHLLAFEAASPIVTTDELQVLGILIDKVLNLFDEHFHESGNIGTLFPIYTSAFEQFSKLTKSEPTIETFRRVAMMHTFPKVAFQCHKMGACRLIDGRCCGLDLIKDNEMKKTETRCGIKMTSNYVKAVRLAVKMEEQAKADVPREGKRVKKERSVEEVERVNEAPIVLEVVQVPTIVVTFPSPVIETAPIPPTDIVLYNSDIVHQCLELLTDKPTYDRIKKRTNFNIPDGWVSFDEVEIQMENLKCVILSSFDHLLGDIKQIRRIHGSAMLFNISKCLDWHNPNIIETSNQKRRSSLVKQDWLKCCPVFEYFGRKGDKIFEIVMKHKLDKVASRIGTTEVVTLRCPEIDLVEMMLEVRDNLSKDRREKAMEFVQYHQHQMKAQSTDQEVVEYLKSVTFGTSEFVGDFSKMVMEQLQKIEEHTAKRAQEYAAQVLCQIHKSQRVAEALVDILDKKSKKEAPIIRTCRNDTLVFVEEVRNGLDRLKGCEIGENDDILPLDEAGVFNYIPKDQILEVCRNQGFLEVPFQTENLDSIQLKSAHAMIPILSPRHSLCIEAHLILQQILHKVRKVDIPIETLKRYVDRLCKHFKPNHRMPFCMDYEIGMKLIEKSDDLFKVEVAQTSTKGKLTIQKFIEIESKSRMFPSFEPLLTSLLADYQQLPSADTLKEIVDIADIRSFLFEFPKIAICYHNQRMCCINGKKQFCSITLIEGLKLDYDVPMRCKFLKQSSSGFPVINKSPHAFPKFRAKK